MSPHVSSLAAALAALAVLAAPALAQPPDSLVLRLTLASPAGNKPAAQFGRAVASAGDLTGDGTDEILVADPYETVNDRPAQGRVYVFDGATGERLLTLTGVPGEAVFFGWSVAGIGDVDGDGVPDVAVGATEEPPYPPAQGFEAGGAYAFSGATGARLWRATIPDPYEFATFGWAVAGVGDVSGDGVPDVAVGSKFETHVLSGADGSVVWVPGGLSIGESVAAVGDVDGDGVGDVAAGGTGYLGPPPERESQVGGVRVLSGATGAIVWAVGSPQPEARGFFGRSVAAVGDVDGDGANDLFVGAIGEGGGDPSTFPGRAYLLSGATGAALDTLVSPTPSTNGLFGHAAAGVAGQLGGGFDVVLAAPSEGPTGAGMVHLFSTASSGWVQAVAAPDSADGFGGSVALARQSDGRFGVVVGATGAPGGGRVYVYAPPEPVATAPMPEAAGLSVAVAPNPSAGAAWATLTVAQAQAVRVAVVDALGRVVAVLHEGPVSAGVQRLALPAGLAAGVYAVVAEGAGARARWVVAR